MFPHWLRAALPVSATAAGTACCFRQARRRRSSRDCTRCSARSWPARMCRRSSRAPVRASSSRLQRSSAKSSSATSPASRPLPPRPASSRSSLACGAPAPPAQSAGTARGMPALAKSSRAMAEVFSATYHASTTAEPCRLCRRSPARPSFDVHLGVLDNGGPEVKVLLDECCELLGAAAHQLHAELGEALRDLRIAQRLESGLVQLGHNVGVHARGSDEARHVEHREVLHAGLREGRRIGQY